MRLAPEEGIQFKTRCREGCRLDRLRGTNRRPAGGQDPLGGPAARERVPDRDATSGSGRTGNESDLDHGYEGVEAGKVAIDVTCRYAGRSRGVNLVVEGITYLLLYFLCTAQLVY